ncbi:MAG: alpha/beta hydrolase [Gemmatimonadetes bacterium]|nr:alpha/beta hydrolase [Gemmatimonadota bacterium]
MRRTVTALVSASVVASPAAAQRLEYRPVPSRGVQAFTFQSPSMGVRFSVNVGTGPSYRPGSTTRYPALITTDGDFAFGTVHESARSLVQEAAIDEIIVVSIGTSYDEGDSTWTRRRIYEFSPPDWDRQDAFGKVVTGACSSYGSAPGRCTGGAPGFLNAIVTELIPLIAERFPIDRADLGLFGISAGGFFASWAMFQPNAPFKKYLISSPAMAYGNGEIFRLESRWAADRKDWPVAIYFGAGDLEIQHQLYEGVGQIVSGMTRLAGLLASRNYPGLRMTTEVHPGMSHGDVMGTVVVRGLRTLYRKGG